MGARVVYPRSQELSAGHSIQQTTAVDRSCLRIHLLLYGSNLCNTFAYLPHDVYKPRRLHGPHLQGPLGLSERPAGVPAGQSDVSVRRHLVDAETTSPAIPHGKRPDDDDSTEKDRGGVGGIAKAEPAARGVR